MNYYDFCIKENIDLIFTKIDFNNRRIDKENGIYTNEWGIIRKTGPEGVDYYVDGPIKTMEDLNKIKIPDPQDDSNFKTLKKVVKK